MQSKKDIMVTLLRKQRGWKSGRKRGPKKLNIVEGADDSTHQDISIVVPTVFSKPHGDLVKARHLEIINSDDPSTSIKTFDQELFHRETSTPHRSAEYVTQSDVLEKNDQLPIDNYANDKVNISDSDEKSQSCSSRQSQTSCDSKIIMEYNREKERDLAFTVIGTQIHYSHLRTLIPEHDIDNLSEMWIQDSVIDAYLAILLCEWSKTNSASAHLDIFVVNTMFLQSFYQADSQHLTIAMCSAMCLFFRHKIPEQHIVIIPSVVENHISAIIVLRKQKIIMCLDSTHKNAKFGLLMQKQVSIIKSMYEMYAKLRKCDFLALDDHKIIFPIDIPQQKNGIDCGVYTCLFLEILLTGKKFFLEYADQEFLVDYRFQIKKKIITYMKQEHSHTPLQAENKLDKQTRRFIENNCSRSCNAIYAKHMESQFTFQTQIGDNEDTLDYMANLTTNYWDEDSFICGKSDCKRQNLLQRDTMILCDKCCRWIHRMCEGLPTIDESNYFTCNDCQ